MTRRLLPTAQHLERLPPELIEPILAELRLGDLISLWHHGGPALRAVINSTSTWAGIWPSDPATIARLVSAYVDVIQPNMAIFKITNGYQGPWRWDLGVFELRKRYVHPQYADVATQCVNTVALWLTEVVDRTTSRDELARFDSSEDAEIWNLTRNERCDFFSRKAKDKQIQNLRDFIKHYHQAQAALNTARSEQISQLANLYKSYPRLLKEPRAPQTDRPNHHHIPTQLTSRSRRTKYAIDLGDASRMYIKCPSLFRFEHAALIPYDWCLRLWFLVLQLDTDHALEASGTKSGAQSPNAKSAPLPPDLPEALSQDFRIASLGLRQCYSLCSKGCQPTPSVDIEHLFQPCPHRVNTSSAEDAGMRIKEVTANEPAAFAIVNRRSSMRDPIDGRELEWLESFCKIIGWMEDAFPDLRKEVLRRHEATTQQQSDAEQQQRARRSRKR